MKITVVRHPEEGGAPACRLPWSSPERDLEAAADLQRLMQPCDTPRVPGYDFAGYCHAGSALSGDFYEYISYPDGGWPS